MRPQSGKHLHILADNSSSMHETTPTRNDPFYAPRYAAHLVALCKTYFDMMEPSDVLKIIFFNDHVVTKTYTKTEVGFEIVSSEGRVGAISEVSKSKDNNSPVDFFNVIRVDIEKQLYCDGSTRLTDVLCENLNVEKHSIVVLFTDGEDKESIATPANLERTQAQLQQMKDNNVEVITCGLGEKYSPGFFTSPDSLLNTLYQNGKHFDLSSSNAATRGLCDYVCGLLPILQVKQAEDDIRKKVVEEEKHLFRLFKKAKSLEEQGRKYDAEGNQRRLDACNLALAARR